MTLLYPTLGTYVLAMSNSVDRKEQYPTLGTRSIVTNFFSIPTLFSAYFSFVNLTRHFLPQMPTGIQRGRPVRSQAVDLSANVARLKTLRSFLPESDIEDDSPSDDEDQPLAPAPVITSNSLPTTSPLHVQRTSTQRSNSCHRRARATARAKAQAVKGSKLKAASVNHRHHATPERFDFSAAEDLHASGPGWTGSSSELYTLGRTISLEEGLKMGLKEYVWDGV